MLDAPSVPAAMFVVEIELCPSQPGKSRKRLDKFSSWDSIDSQCCCWPDSGRVQRKGACVLILLLSLSPALHRWLFPELESRNTRRCPGQPPHTGCPASLIGYLYTKACHGRCSWNSMSNAEKELSLEMHEKHNIPVDRVRGNESD